MPIQSIISTVKGYGIRESIVSIPYALSYYIQKHGLRRQFLRRRIFDYLMCLDLWDPGISKTLAIFGKRELEHRYILEQELKPGMVVWDLGANIGYYAIMEAKLVGNLGKVYAVEPSPSNIALLKKNIVLNQCENIIEVSPVGISNRNGRAELSEMSNVNTFHPNLRSGERATHLTGKTIMVPIMDVPTFIHGKRSVDLVRMDIEGHEVEVFEGIIRSAKGGSSPSKILFETHLTKYDDTHHSMRAQLKGLLGIGYYPKILAANEEKRTFRAKGYSPEKLIRTDGTTRGIYRNVSSEDAIELICNEGGVRTVLLEHRKI